MGRSLAQASLGLRTALEEAEEWWQGRRQDLPWGAGGLNRLGYTQFLGLTAVG